MSRVGTAKYFHPTHPETDTKPMNNLPQRISLVSQTVDVLKNEIRLGRWSKQLPGEHELCALLHVGRVTLRSALARLDREGWLKTSKGRRREIVHKRAKPAREQSNRVALLTPLPMHQLQPHTIYWIDGLRVHLAEAGYHLEVHEHRDCYSGKPEGALDALVRRTNAAGWVLTHSTARMQKWFSQHAMPCVITGSRHEDVSLPSLDRDYRAISRHAVGALLARGHRRVAIINPGTALAGDRESEEGFKEGAQKTSLTGVEARVFNHSGSVADICSKLELALKGSAATTGFLVARSHHTLTVMSSLLGRGLRFPKDVALISRDDDPFLASLVPSVARYSLSPSFLARTISNLVVNTVRGGLVDARESRVMPEFVNGQTLG